MSIRLTIQLEDFIDFLQECLTSYVEELSRIRKQYQNYLLAFPNVVGVGIGYKKKDGKTLDELSLVAMVRSKVSKVSLSKDSVIPDELGGVKTDVIEVGQIRAMQSVRDRWRPAMGGVSLGHYKITTGTLGCIVYDSLQHTPRILSNNHILANGNSCSLGDPILQQGRSDGGVLGRDTMALLTKYMPLKYLDSEDLKPLPDFVVRWGLKLSDLLNNAQWRIFFEKRSKKINPIDAALAKPLDASLVSDEVYSIGKPDGIQQANLGLKVRKCGRTTGLTSGTIELINATLVVGYGDTQNARFENQIVSTSMCQGGDSGSILFAANSTKAVGLLFAGSSQATIFNPIETVLETLRVSLTP